MIVLIIIILIVSVVVAFLAWRGDWFGIRTKLSGGGAVGPGGSSIKVDPWAVDEEGTGPMSEPPYLADLRKMFDEAEDKKPDGGIPKDKRDVFFRNMFAKNGKTKLGNKPRPDRYQICLSFPGAAFEFKFRDVDGKTANSGFDLAMWFHDYLREQLLGGNRGMAIRNIYLDWMGLQYVPGTVETKNFRGQKGKTAYLNDHWKLYYQEAMREASLAVVFVSKGWIESPNCELEFNELVALNPKFRPRIFFIVLEAAVTEHSNFPKLEAGCEKMGAEILHYTQGNREQKQHVEDHVFGTINNLNTPRDFGTPQRIIERTEEWKPYVPKPALPSAKKYEADAEENV